MNTVSSRATGEITGWFERTRTRLFGQRDRVESQLHDIARQGSAGARVSHWFAGGLIILFSLASLVALGADALVAVQQGLTRGRLDVPSAIALGVTALLVPAMDVAMLQAASVIRILATRRAETREMRLHIAVVIGVSVVEAGTYCYMSYRYEHPADAIAWVLIAARALAAPLLSVYLAMARPQPVTSRDILAQVELGAGQGVIRDVTNIANDPTAPLDRKMELFAASAIMRETEAARLERLIAVAQHNTQRALPSARVYGAASTLPEPQPVIHHQYHTPIPTHKAMHEGWSDDEIINEYADEIADEVEDESDLFSTRKIPAVSSRPAVVSQPATNDTKQRTPRGLDSGLKRGNSDRSKSLRKANADLRAEAKRLRRSRIRDAAYAVLDEWYASGQSERLSDKELTRRVQARVDFDVNPSGNTVARWRGPWQSSRAHKAVMEATNLNDDVVPMEPQELRELQEVW